MALTSEKTREIIIKFGKNEKDTGTVEVQVALMSAQIDLLSGHFKTHKKDKHSQRGLMKTINQRRKLLNYLKTKDKVRYQKLIEALGLRH